MSIVRYRQFQTDPLSSDGLRQMLDSLGHSTASAAWVPAVDIVEEPSRFLIRADLPGVDPAGIDLLIERNELVLRGERQPPLVSGEGRLSRSERGFGNFERRFVLPDSVDASQVGAHGSHGVLEVWLPKKAEAGPRRISIGAGLPLESSVPAVVAATTQADPATVDAGRAAD